MTHFIIRRGRDATAPFNVLLDTDVLVDMPVLPRIGEELCVEAGHLVATRIIHRQHQAPMVIASPVPTLDQWPIPGRQPPPSSHD